MARTQASIAAALLALAACGPAGLPKQARFEVSACDSLADLFSLDGRSARVHSEPVLTPGPAGAWDSLDTLNPSVIRAGAGLYNFYSGFDGKTWRTGLATSSNGLTWTKLESNPILEPDPSTWEGEYIAANGAALHDGRQFRYWYQAGPRNATQIGLALSPDANTWQKHPGPVLETGPPGTWDESGLGDPYALACGNTFYLYYLGQNRRGLQRLGVARSLDGLHWQKSHANPILDLGPPGDFDERGLGEPAVFHAGNSFWMLYTGRNAQENRAIGWATSSDGINWKKLRAQPLPPGALAWNRSVMCDPEVAFLDGVPRIWFGAGDRPSPDENLNGVIGYAELLPANGNLSGPASDVMNRQAIPEVSAQTP